ncbi:hypothetical protein L596_027051 [Steinernema carpocapsae]|uniref:Uncharacterized protein n=1 Tax=Steinernema carpocapsae TaxID=34508 RepID=A0A4U5M382_STECR|nr:hypothetical protein L596_027051 [Steinernema carpocapsae]
MVPELKRPNSCCPDERKRLFPALGKEKKRLIRKSSKTVEGFEYEMQENSQSDSVLRKLTTFLVHCASVATLGTLLLTT